MYETFRLKFHTQGELRADKQSGTKRGKNNVPVLLPKITIFRK